MFIVRPSKLITELYGYKRLSFEYHVCPYELKILDENIEYRDEKNCSLYNEDFNKKHCCFGDELDDRCTYPFDYISGNKKEKIEICTSKPLF